MKSRHNKPRHLSRCIWISKIVCLSCEAIIFKPENAATFFFLQNYYNMHKTLLGGGYLICNIKVTIFLDCTMIADKKCQSREMKL